jgi:hypothetical protein
MQLGTLRPVDLREAWPNEAQDFTPWLAAHLGMLGDALGFDLELDSQEAAVGPFALDILARDVTRNQPVVIENQLTETDHDHLGKLLTYAAGYDARVVIWLCKDFREEHRQALDWLNQRTDENTEFFGVVVELLKIDDSLTAPNFKLMAFPNQWRKTRAKTERRSTPSARMEAYQAFFQAVMDTLREEYRFTGARKAQPQSWVLYASGHSGISYGTSFAQGGKAQVEVYIDRKDTDWNKNVFEKLEAENRPAIESAFGETLNWERLDNRRASRISLNRDGSIDDEPEVLVEIEDWMIQMVLQFKQVFDPILRDLVGQQR